MDYLELAKDIVGKASASGAEVEAYIQAGKKTEIRVGKGEVEKLSQSGSKGLGVRVIAEGGRVGYAYTSDFSPEGVERTWQGALAMANHAIFHRPGAALRQASPRDRRPGRVRRSPDGRERLRHYAASHPGPLGCDRRPDCHASAALCEVVLVGRARRCGDFPRSRADSLSLGRRGDTSFFASLRAWDV